MSQAPTQPKLTPLSLEELESKNEFLHRHIGPRPADIAAMLANLSLSSLEELIQKAVPAKIQDNSPLNLPGARTESEVIQYLAALADSNQRRKSFLGAGYSDSITPPVILRNILENPGWYTSYTPYQAEISQGRMEALLNFQTMVIDLTGMEIANSSLLDEPTAAAEAMSMFLAVQSKQGRGAFGISEDCHPQTIEVVRTRAEPLGVDVIVRPWSELQFDGRLFGVLLQYPTTEGAICDYAHLIERAHSDQVLVAVAADLLSLVLLKPPGEFGADVVIGNSQRFGVPLGFGGPHAAYLATRESFKRHVPGRMVGVSKDSHGNPALRLALQTREQHIRREKATSNICTAQVLLAIMAGMYGVYHGPEGLKRIAQRVHLLASILAAGLKRLGLELVHNDFFDTVVVRVSPGDVRDIRERSATAGVNFRYIGSDRIAMSLDQTTTRDDLHTLWRVLGGPATRLRVEDLQKDAVSHLPARLERGTEFLLHPVFHSYRSETEMLRYLYRLQEKDLSLTKSMIPLGSCTMKLNATAEMVPISFPGFANVHPFVPLEQVPGYLKLIEELKSMLAEITGFSDVSLQPNAGSQGEYAGLLIIRRFHREAGQEHRDICLIPSSAHGTNPASAAMAGFQVVVVRCDDEGNIDLEDLGSKAEQHRDRLAALMITYPSTHGVFEEGIVDICQIIHANGGQVYLDGANLNALVGLCRPGRIGPDVAHLNLHKTFCIPHGGGGPGVGPIAVADHLAPFLPNHSVVEEAGPPSGISAVSGAPWGSSGILPISWAYIALMGAEGLRKATQVAILNANYVAHRLAPYYPILYRGRNGMVAHECIVDCRPLREAGIEVDDIAKRLMDYGFHAPTMSWPVAGTLMVEPTESESKEELDRFCDAMIQIRKEISAVESGEWDLEDNPLKNAPHTAESLAGDWQHPYDRQAAAFPLPWVREHKFWPAVGRVDNVYGDRHFFCSCLPVDSYASEEDTP